MEDARTLVWESKPLQAQNRVSHSWPKQYTPPLYLSECGGGRSSSPNHQLQLLGPWASSGFTALANRSLRSPTLRPPANPRVLGFALLGGRNVSNWQDVRRKIDFPPYFGVARPDLRPTGSLHIFRNLKSSSDCSS